MWWAEKAKDAAATAVTGCWKGRRWLQTQSKRTSNHCRWNKDPWSASGVTKKSGEA